MLILSIVVGALFLCWLINVAVKEDNKTQQQVKGKESEAKVTDGTLSSFDALIEKLGDKFKDVSYGRYEASYKTLKLCCVFVESRFSLYSSQNVYIRTKEGGMLSYGRHSNIECQGNIKEFIDENYSGCFSLAEKVYLFINDLIKHAVVYKSTRLKLHEFYKEKGIRFYDGSDDMIWYSVNDGEYYTYCQHSLMRLSDWKEVPEDEAYEIVKNAKIELSEDPKKVHWEHFLKLEMLEKKAREKRMQEFVDSVLSKQVRYNDLQLQYDMLPTAPITDIDTFLNFCKIVKEDVYYEDHEIQNYIFMKKLK